MVESKTVSIPVEVRTKKAPRSICLSFGGGKIKDRRKHVGDFHINLGGNVLINLYEGGMKDSDPTLGGMQIKINMADILKQVYNEIGKPFVYPKKQKGNKKQ